MGVEEFLAQRLEPVDTTGDEREIAAHGSEPAGHALAEAGARAGDQGAAADGGGGRGSDRGARALAGAGARAGDEEALACGVRHRDSMPPPVRGAFMAINA